MVPLVLVAAVEFALAFVLRHEMAQYDMAHLHAAAAWSPTTFAVGALSTVVLAVLTLHLQKQPSRGRVLIGVLIAIAAASVGASPGMQRSILLLMVAVELIIVVVPLAMLGTIPARGAADDVWVVARGALALATGAVLVTILVAVHLPTSHDTLFAAGPAPSWAFPLSLAAALAFWASVMRFRLPTVWRATLIILVLETASVLGLAMLMAPGAMAMDGALGLSSLADHRLAGTWMMLVDLGVLAAFVSPMRSHSSGRVLAATSNAA